MNSRGINQFISIARRLPPKYWVVLGVLAAVYFFAEPKLETALGRPLPGFNDNQKVAATINDQAAGGQSTTGQTTGGQIAGGPAATMGSANSKSANRKSLDDLFDQNRNSSPSGSNPNTSSSSPSTSSNKNTSSKKSTTSGKAALGTLTEIGRKVFKSTAGLVYTPGSQEGHRLAHIERHTEDQPNRNGSHGVFDGGREGMLAVLDEAYLLALKGGRDVQSEKQDSRTVYTVNLRRRVGFIGGQSGKRKNNPPVNRVRLVLEGEKVITAYPYK